jgi:selenocysteine-specific elongation factor
MPRGEVRSRVQALLPGSQLSVRLFNALLDAAAQAGRMEADDSVVWRAGFTATLTLQQQATVDELLAQFARAPYAPPNLQESLRVLGNDAELLAMLVDRGQLVRIGGDVLLRGEDFDAMLKRIQVHLQSEGTITLAETRDLFQTSRKYAQAVLEEMDARRITRREGEARVLR